MVKLPQAAHFDFWLAYVWTWQASLSATSEGPHCVVACKCIVG
jgi:hypothetical protein